MIDAETMRGASETHRVIKGRRWRVSDPALDEPIRQLLVDELMHARRAVKTALAAADEAAEQIARRRVHDAKVALGERGPKWWEEMTQADIDTRTHAFIGAVGDRLGDIDTAKAHSFLRLSARRTPDDHISQPDTPQGADMNEHTT